MVVIGIDVAILGCVALALIVAACVASAWFGLAEDAGWSLIAGTAITGGSMLLAYIIMAHILDNLLGAYGW